MRLQPQFGTNMNSKFIFKFSALLFCSSINAASFDCTKAGNTFEKAICENHNISNLDDQLSNQYKKSLEISSMPNKLKQEQIDWIKTTRLCADNTECIKTAYTKRISELKNVGSNESTTKADNLFYNVKSPVNSTEDQDGKTLKTIIAEGIGKDIESALKNAAENGLMQVVGTFVDTQKQLEKRTTIIDGVRSETKNLSSTINEYSQGTIKHFETLDVSQTDGITRVSAKIVVRIDDFHAYIKKLAEVEVAVNEGLFVKMSTEKKQNENLSSIIAGIIKPIASGEVIEFSVDEPKQLSELEGKYCSNNCINAIKEIAGGGFVVGFEVKESLSDAFKKNMLKTLESIASEKNQYTYWGATFFNSNLQPIPSIQDTNDVSLLVNIDGIKVPVSKSRHNTDYGIVVDAYKMKGIRDNFLSELNAKDRTFNHLSKTLNIDILDSENSVIHSSDSLTSQYKVIVLPSNIPPSEEYHLLPIGAPHKDRHYTNDYFIYKLLEGQIQSGIGVIYTTKSFKVFMSIDENVLAKAKKIKLYLK
jgi:uncharacterized protein